MDWSRAKSIIILLLIAFNIFLSANIIAYARGQSIPRETIQNTIDILKTRGVRLECALPTYNSDTPKLIYGKSAINEKAIADKLLGASYGARESGDAGANGSNKLSTFTSGSRKLSFDSRGLVFYEDEKPSANFDVSNRKAAERYLRNFVKDTGLMDDSYVFDKAISNKDGSISLYFLEKYKGYLVFDNYLKATVKNNGVTKLEAGRRELQDLSQDKAGDLAAAYQVLLGNFEAGEHIVITSIDFGFYNANEAQLNGAGSYEQLPVWRIETAQSDVPRYFSASDGKEIKQR